MLRGLITLFVITCITWSPALSQEHNSTSTDSRTIIVFDASGSMWGQIDGKAKISIAKDTFHSLFEKLQHNAKVGLIAYGHNRKGDCNDIETLVPVNKVASNRNSLKDAVDKLSPKGKTPLSKAVRQAAEALKYTEEQATVVLERMGLRLVMQILVL